MKRALLFLLLLGLGVMLLLVLAKDEGDLPRDVGPERPIPPSSAPSPEAGSSRTYIEGFLFSFDRIEPDLEGLPRRIPEYKFQSRRAFDVGGGSYKVEEAVLTVFQQTDPSAAAMVLRASRGAIYVSGPPGSEQLDEDKPVHFEEVVVDLADSKGQSPPLRVRTPSVEGLMKARKFWTEARAEIEQADSPDLLASGEGLEGDADAGTLLLKRNPELRYLVRPKEGAPPERELRLRCGGPLRIERLVETPAASPSPQRFAEAEGDAVLEIEDLRARSLEVVRAERLVAQFRSETPREPSALDVKNRAPLAFERIEARGRVRIEAEQALFFGEQALAEIGPTGKLLRAAVAGSPRAAFSASNAAALRGGPGASPGGAFFVQCDGPLLLAQGEEGRETFRATFQDRVLLFGTGGPPYLPCRLGAHLDLLLEKIPETEGRPAAFRLVAAHGEGDVDWKGEGSAVRAPLMQIEEGEGGQRVSFFPAPLLRTQMASLMDVSDPSPKTLFLAPERTLVQEEGVTTLEGLVLGRILGPRGTGGRLESNGLGLLAKEGSKPQMLAERGFRYEEGDAGLRIEAEQARPSGAGGLLLLGAPARLRLPSAEGHPLDIEGRRIEVQPRTGDLRAEGEVSARLPPGSANLLPDEKPEPVLLECGLLESRRRQDGQGLEWMHASLGVRLKSRNQEGEGESLHMDFSSGVHRLFGSAEDRAKLSGPLDQGRFEAFAARIEIRDEGNRIDLSPGATVLIQGAAVDLGNLARRREAPDGSEGGVRVFPRGESVLLRERIVFGGGVRLESAGSGRDPDWTLFSRDLVFHRVAETGTLERLEARGDAEFASLDLIARGKQLNYHPKTSDLFIVGEGDQPGILEIPSRLHVEGDDIGYNLAQRQLRSGPGRLVLTR